MSAEGLGAGVELNSTGAGVLESASAEVGSLEKAFGVSDDFGSSTRVSEKTGAGDVELVPSVVTGASVAGSVCSLFGASALVVIAASGGIFDVT